jgi:hypothetical protein
MSYYNNKLGLDEKLFVKTDKIITSSLKNKNFLTRQDLKRIINEAGIKTEVQSLSHIVMHAELNALICSGPRKGNQFTYALAEEVVPKFRNISRDEALKELTYKYFRSHGPALLKDFSWWSGLTSKMVVEGINFNKSDLSKFNSGNKEYWYVKKHLSNSGFSDQVLLTSVYDEYFIGYKNRDILFERKSQNNLPSVGNALLTSLIFINGKVVGSWKRKLKKNHLEFTKHLFRKLSRSEEINLKNSVASYANFLGLKAVIL